MQEKLQNIKSQALAQIVNAEDLGELEKLRIEYLGKTAGKLTLLIKELPKLSPADKTVIGPLANGIKKIIEDALISQEQLLRDQKSQNIDQAERLDVTLPGLRPLLGHLHPVTQVLHEVLDIFKSLGYQVTDTHEIVSDYYNFTALNMPPDAPSRDTQATFYLNKDTILQTQVTSMQVPILEKTKPPVRAIMPGKVYRVDDVDPSHGFEFWQLDGVVIDKNIHMSDLLGTLEYVLKKLFNNEIKVRFDATYFAFVEPGVQAMMSCTICKQKGCPFCKNTGWVEIFPAGMVHPSVLKCANLDPSEWGGFAFDLGLGRVAALKYQINDLRILTNPDLRILKQF